MDILQHSPIETLIGKLDGVKRHGDSYRAKCPAHDGKNRDVLAVAQGDDGRVLIHCFAECTPAEVLAAVAVVASLLYLARQVRDGKNTTQSATHFQVTEALNSAFFSIMQDPALFKIYK